MTSLLLLKIIYVLANFLDFIWVLTLAFSRFSVYVYFEGNLDSANKFNNNIYIYLATAKSEAPIDKFIT